VVSDSKARKQQMQMKRSELDNRRRIRRDEANLCDRHTTQSKFYSRRSSNGFRVLQWRRERSVVRGKIPFPNPGLPWRAAVLLLVGLAAFGFPARAQDTGPTEYQLKAAFVYNFVKFVEWPAPAYASPTSPTVIGVLGKNVFGDALEKIIHDKVVNHHPLQFKAFDSAEQVTNCQILFISASERNRFPQILAALRGKSILTVSDSDPFLHDGGMINFIIVNRKVSFQINNQTARQAGLIISSDLLSLAAPIR